MNTLKRLEDSDFYNIFNERKNDIRSNNLFRNELQSSVYTNPLPFGGLGGVVRQGLRKVANLELVIYRH